MIDIRPYRHIALAISREYFMPGYERQDVEQEAMIGLWLAARDYRPELAPGGFERWAAFCIRRRVQQSVKLANRVKHGPLNSSAREHVPGAATPDPADILVAKEDALELLRRVREDLSPVERRCLIGVANGLSHREINEEVGGNVGMKKDGHKRYRRVDNAIARANAKLAA